MKQALVHLYLSPQSCPADRLHGCRHRSGHRLAGAPGLSDHASDDDRRAAGHWLRQSRPCPGLGRGAAAPVRRGGAALVQLRRQGGGTAALGLQALVAPIPAAQARPVARGLAALLASTAATAGAPANTADHAGRRPAHGRNASAAATGCRTAARSSWMPARPPTLPTATPPPGARAKARCWRRWLPARRASRCARSSCKAPRARPRRWARASWCAGQKAAPWVHVLEHSVLLTSLNGRQQRLQEAAAPGSTPTASARRACTAPAPGPTASSTCATSRWAR